jgi:tRNA-dihydrouridine synthase B
VQRSRCLNTMITIGSVQIAANIFLAPLSGCSDLAFRLIAREGGAKLCFFEMVDAHSMVSPNPKKFDILKTVAQDTPIAAQLLGADPVLMRDAAQILLSQAPAVFLDVNSACPVKKVVKKGAGSALLNTPQVLARIVQTLVSACPVPITVKLRLGFTRIDLPALRDLAQACEANGAAALFVHGRTRVQAYTGEIDYEAIRAVKHAVQIPVFGSGNIFTPQLARRMLAETDCDGLLVARGAFGNPWIFQEIEHYLHHGIVPVERGLEVKKSVLKKHLAYIVQYRNGTPSGKVGFMRKVALWYLKGFPDAAKLRNQVSTIPDYEMLVQFIEHNIPG